MNQLQPAKEYARLLSVYLYGLMEDGEKILGKQAQEKVFLETSLPEKIQHVRLWLELLARIDPSLPQDTAGLLRGKSKLITVDNIEDMSNATAQTLMLLEDHYRIFSTPSHQQPLPNHIPLLSLQDITPDTAS